MRILLINPRNTIHRSTLRNHNCFPLGLAHIAAVCRDRGHEVSILDAYGEGLRRRHRVDRHFVDFGLPDEDIENRVRGFNPDLVGISSPFSVQHHNTLAHARLVRRVCPGVPIVCGGPHVSALPHTLPPDLIDFAVLGEGELATAELATFLSEGGTGDLPKGVIRPSERAHDQSSITRVGDLSGLPWPAYDLLPLEEHWRHNRARVVPLLATRGCPFDCNFCSATLTMGHRLRRRPMDDVVAELTTLQKKYGVRRVHFEDDNLTANMDWAKELFEKIIGAGLNLSFFPRNGIRADRVDLELLSLMKRAGLGQVAFAPESGNQEVLDQIIGKRLRLEQVERSVDLARQAGMWISCFLIIGFPEETLVQVKRTIEYGHDLRRRGVDRIWLHCATPHPGTALWQQCQERGWVSEDMDFRALLKTRPVVESEEFSSHELHRIQRRAMRSYRPSRARHMMTRGFQLALTDPKRLLRRTRQLILRTAD